MTAPTLRFDGVSKWYGQISALADIGFEIGPGVTGLVGHNGSGKTTILKLLAGMLTPSQGRIEVLGASPERPATRRAVGYCPDVDRFYEGISGRQFVAWMLRLDGLSKTESNQRAARVLDELGLGEAMGRPIRTYSKGMRQRVKLAQALGKSPQVVLLDEPLTGLDPVARHEVSAVIRALGDQGATVLVSSHVLHELETLAGAGVLLIHQGRLLAQGEVASLRDQLDDRPRRLRLRSPEPRRLAAQLIAIEAVESVVLRDLDLVLSVDGSGFFEELTRIGASGDGLVAEVEPIDDGLEAVFGYLAR